MSAIKVPRSALRSLTRLAPKSPTEKLRRVATRSRVCQQCFSTTPAIARQWRHRPTAREGSQDGMFRCHFQFPRRTIFIQTEETPNSDALKFNPSTRVLPEGFPSPFVEYLSPRATLQAPHPSQLAGKLLNIDGVTSVFFHADYITVTKDSSAPWAHIKPDVFAIMNEHMISGQPTVTTVESRGSDAEQGTGSKDSLAYDENDSEVVGMIKELLDTRIRPAIQEDGGDIEYRGFHDGYVLLKLRGACRTCDSSTVTLKNGIESMMQHYLGDQIVGVQQVMDQEEEIALQEFAKFEEKLREQKGPHATASTVGKGSLDTVEG